MESKTNITPDQLFGFVKITENECMIFYYFSIISFFLIAVSIGRFSVSLFQNASSDKMATFLQLLVLLVVTVGLQYLAYYSHRILYSMCMKSIEK